MRKSFSAALCLKCYAILVVVVSAFGIPTGAYADDRHTFHISNTIPVDLPPNQNVRLTNGRILIDPENNCPQSWGFLQPPGDLPNGTGTAVFEVHGSAWCNIVGTLGSGLFRYDVQQESPINNQWTTVGLVEGTIYFQENWGTYINDEMDATQCNGPITCTVQRLSYGDNSVATFIIAYSPPTPSGRVGGPENVFPDITLGLQNATSYTAWQDTLNTYGSTYCDSGADAPPGAIYPHTNNLFCMVPSYFVDSGFDAVYKLVDSDNNIVSTCELHPRKNGSDNTRTCDNCVCDGSVKAMVTPYGDGTGYSITWVPATSIP